MKQYVRGLGSHLVDFAYDDEITTVSSRTYEEKTVPLYSITIPQIWDFRNISGAGKRERIARHVLETLFNDNFGSVRPEWLKNDRTGRNLEIDCYNEKINLAVEVSGKQHFVFENNGFHKTREQFLDQVYRDRVKREKILARGINFIVLPYTIPTDQIPTYLIEMIQRLNE